MEKDLGERGEQEPDGHSQSFRNQVWTRKKLAHGQISPVGSLSSVEDPWSPVWNLQNTHSLRETRFSGILNLIHSAKTDGIKQVGRCI